MSTTIDQRVVEMRFDNKQFEENVAESINTLGKLDKALKFNNTGESFGEITKAAEKVDLSPISNSVESVMLKFNLLEVAAIQVFSNIINDGVNKLKSAINDLSFKQVTEGWGKYQEKTESVQTIMAATGKTIDEVSEQLDRLNWFSDETSYSFVDMTSNVGKFTSVGVDLEKAVSAMEGISTWAALSGANVQEASRAMYNLSQAMGVGAVKLMDWRSIENAGMATTEFKNVVMDTAAAMGTLIKYADGTYQTLEATDVTASNFNSTLSEGWFSAEVLMESLSVYGDFANELSKACEDLDVEALDLITAIKNYDGSSESFEELMDESGKSAEELIPILDKLTSSEYELGRKAFFAAQESKTFKDTLDATADAVSTKWLNIFEILFGNYEQAKVFFTDMTEIFYDMFVEDVSQLKNFLKEWNGFYQLTEDGEKRLMGDIFRTGLTDFLWGVDNVLNVIKSTLKVIIPPMTVDQLAKLTIRFGEMMEKFEHFTAEYSISEKTTERLKSVWSGITSVFDIFKQILSSLSPIFSLVVKGIKVLADDALDVIARFGDWTTALSKSIREHEVFKKIIETITNVLGPFIEKIGNLYNRLKQKINTADFSVLYGLLDKISVVLEPVRTKIADFYNSIKQRIELTDLSFFSDILEKIKETFKKIDLGPVWEKIKKTLSNVKTDVTEFFKSLDVGGFFRNIWDYISETAKKVKDFISNIDFGELGAKVWGGLKVVGTNITEFFKGFGTGISGIFGGVSENLKSPSTNLFANLFKGLFIFNGFKSLMGGGEEGGNIFEKLLSPITSLLEGLKEKLDDFVNETDDDKLKDIAISIGILAGALLLLASIDSEKVDDALLGMAAAIGAMNLEMKWLMGLDVEKLSGAKKAGTAMIEISGALLIFSWAAKNFAAVEWGDIGKAGATLGGLLLAILALGEIFKLTELSGGTMIATALAMDLIGIALQEIALAALAFQHIRWESLEKAAIMLSLLTVLEGVIGIVSAFSGGLNIILAAAGMDLIAAALIEMSVAAAAFSLIPEEGLKKTAIALLEMLGIFVGITAAATIFLPGLLGIAAVLVSIGATVFLIGAGIALIGEGIRAVGEGIKALGLGALFVSLTSVAEGLSTLFAGLGIGAMEKAIDLLIESIGKLVAMVPAFVSGFVVGVIDGITQVADAFFGMAETILPGIIDMFMTILLEISESVEKNIEPILDNVIKIIIKILAALADNAGPLIEELVKLVCNLLDGLKDHIPTLLTSALGFLDALLGEILKTIRTFFSESKEGTESSVGLPKLGKELSDFWKSIKPFVDGVKGLKPEDLENVSNLAMAILAITAAEVLGGLTNWFGHSKTITEFCNDLTLFAPALKKFGQELEGVDKEAISAGTAAIANIATAFNSEIFKTGGLIQKIKGEMKNLESLGEDLVKIAPKLREFETAMNGTDPEDVAKSAKSVTTIAEAFDKNVFKTNGLAQIVKGEMTDLKKLGENLVAIAPKLREFETIMTGTKPDDVTNAAKSITAIAEAFDADTFKTGGLTKFFSGETVDLGVLGQQITEFANNITTIAPEFPSKALLAKEALQNFALNFPALVLTTNFSATELLDSMTNLVKLGVYVSSYYDTISDIDPAKMGSVTQAINELFDLTSNTDLSTENLSGTFTLTMADVADAGIISFINAIDASKELVYEKGRTLLEKFIEGAKSKKDDAVSAFAKIVSDALNEIKKKEQDFKNEGTSLVNQLKSAFVKERGTVSTTVKDFVLSLVTTVRERYTDFYNAGAYLMDGLKLGMTDRLYDFQNTIYQIGDTIVTSMENELGIQSPSKVFYELGAYTAEGFVNGMKDWISDIGRTSEELGKTAMTAISDSIDDFLQNEADMTPVIRPVLDLSDLESGSRRLNSMFSSDMAYAVGAEAAETAEAVGNSVNNSRNFGGFTFNIYPQGNVSDPEELAYVFGEEIMRRMRIFSTI